MPPGPWSHLLNEHLVRLLAAGGTSVVGGLLLVWRYRGMRPFGAMTAIWGGIDVLIALASFRASPGSLDALRTFLAFNLGLNLGYVGVGIAMAALAGERGTIRGFGQAIAVQGLILLGLDGMLWTALPTGAMRV